MFLIPVQNFLQSSSIADRLRRLSFLATLVLTGAGALQAETFDAWRTVHFSESELFDASTSGASADPDFDSFVNLMEFGMGLDPHQNDNAYPSSNIQGDHLTLTFRVNPQAGNLLYFLESSNTLQGWVRHNSVTILAEEDFGSYLMRTVQDPVFSAGLTKRFLRLTLALDPNGTGVSRGGPDFLYTPTPPAVPIRMEWRDRSNAEAGFLIERKEGIAGPWLELISIGADTSEYQDNTAQDNHEYFYRVAALFETGTPGTYEQSEFSAELQVAPKVTLLPLEVLWISASEILLRWDAVMPTPSGFRIERGDANSWTTLTTLAPSALEFTDRNLISATNYKYRVVALNSSGQIQAIASGEAAYPDLSGDPNGDWDLDGWINGQDSNPWNYYIQGTQTVTPVITIESGNAQRAIAGAFAAEPLVVKVTNSSDQILNNAPVDFIGLTELSGLASAAGGATGSPLSVRTNSSGLASVYLKMPPAVGNVTVRAAAKEAFVEFSATSSASVEVVDGDKQGVLTGNWTWKPLKVRATDSDGNPLATSLEANIEAENTGGMALTNQDEPQSTLSLTTDANGEAEFWFKAADLPGAPARVFVQPPGHPEDKATIQLAVRSSLGLPPVIHGLAAWYPGEQNADDNWGLHHATNHGAGFATGMRGQAFDVDGVSDYIQTPIPNGGERTLVAWFKARTSDDVDYIESIFDTEITSEYGSGFGLDNGKLKAILDNQFWSPEIPIVIDQWHQAALSFNGTEARIYLDGQLVGTLPYTQGAITQALYKLGSSNANLLFFDGLIDEAFIYERALTSEEILALYNWMSEPCTATPHTVEMQEDHTAVFTLAGTSPRGLAVNVHVVNTPEHGEITQVGSQITYVPDLNYHGPDGFAFYVDDLASPSDLAAVLINVGSVNDEPWVVAGENQSIRLPDSATLAGIVTDVDTPAASLILEWRKESGPGTVTFTNPSSASTQAAFSEAGSYILRLSARDGIAWRSDSIQIDVSSPSEVWPTIQLVSPSSSQVITDPILHLEAAATGDVSRVEFYLGSKKVTQDTAAPWEADLSALTTGSYRVSAAAVTPSGAKIFTPGVIVRVGTAPLSDPGNDGSFDNDGSSGFGTPGGGGGGSGSGGGSGDGSDADGDGLTESEEDETGTDPGSSDSDNDNSPDGIDQYPADDRRSEDIASVGYVLIDLGKGVIPEGTDVDMIAMGQDGRVAFSWWESGDYKVAKWKNGSIEGTPQVTATHIQFYNDRDGEYTDPKKIAVNNWRRRSLSADGAVVMEGAVIEDTETEFYNHGSIALWPFGVAVAKDLTWFNLANDFGWTFQQFLENGGLIGVRLDRNYPESLLSIGILSASTQEVDYTYEDTTEYYYAAASSSVSLNGWVGIDYHKRDAEGDTEKLFIVSPQGGATTIFSAQGSFGSDLGNAGIPVINDNQEFILAGSDSGQFVSYLGSTSHGKLEDLLPQKYKKQILQPGQSIDPNAQMLSLANNGTLLCTMSSLEGEGEGTWIKRTFVSQKTAATPDDHPRDLQMVRFPDGWEITPIGGSTGFNDTGIIVAKASKTIDENGTPIPEENQHARPCLLLPVEFLTKGPNGEFLQQTVTWNSVSAPQIEVTDTSASLSGNTLTVHISGKVTDATSDCTPTAGKQVQTIYFNGGNGESQQTLSNSATPDADDPWRPYKFEANFNKTLSVPFGGRGTYSIQLKTSENAGGLAGSSEIDVNVHVHYLAADVQITVPQSISDQQADEISLTIPDLTGSEIQVLLMETSTESRFFTGSVDGVQYHVNLPQFNGLTSSVDIFPGSITKTVDGQIPQTVNFSFEETVATSRIFKGVPAEPLPYIVNASVGASSGSGTFLPTIVRFPADVAQVFGEDGLKISIMDRQWKVEEKTFDGDRHSYVVDDTGKPAVFNPSLYAHSDIQTKKLVDGKFPLTVQNLQGFEIGTYDVPAASGLLIWGARDISKSILDKCLPSYDKKLHKLTGKSRGGMALPPRLAWVYTPKSKPLPYKIAGSTTADIVRTELLWRCVGTEETIAAFEDDMELERDIAYRVKICETARTCTPPQFGEKDIASSQYWQYKDLAYGPKERSMYPEALADVFKGRGPAVEAQPNYALGCTAMASCLHALAACDALGKEEFMRRMPDVIQHPGYYLNHTMKGRKVPPGHETNWFPGDWGYLDNDNISASESSALSGENVFYIGGCFEMDPAAFKAGALFFGNWSQDRISTLDKWIVAVSNFRYPPQNPRPPSTVTIDPWRKFLRQPARTQN